MGSCASADKSRPGPPMKLVAFGTRADSLVNPESPKKENSAPLTNPPETAADDGGGPAKTRRSLYSAEKSLESPRKENLVRVDTPTAREDRPVKSRWSFSSDKKSFGSKGETFFDSQAWLESDDEFHSVNGDFTPSRGNTPKNSFSERLPRVHNLLFEEKEKPQGPSVLPPLFPRKKLAELFRDSIREEREGSSGRSKRSARNTPRVSGANPNAIDDASVNKREKTLKSANGCLPGFVSCGSSSVKRKKMSPEAVAVK